VSSKACGDDEIAPDEFTTNHISLKAEPNPFSDNLIIEFSLPIDTKAKVEIYNLSGQRLATVFDGDVKAAVINKVKYIPAANCGCIIIYRLQTVQGTYYGKVMMVK
jgi:hypothetical protein